MLHIYANFKAKTDGCVPFYWSKVGK